MTKVSRREAVLAILVGSSSLMIEACKAPIFKDQLPIPPERCVWLELPYSFVCIDLQTLTDGDSNVSSRGSPRVLANCPKQKDLSGFSTPGLPSKEWVDCRIVAQ